MSSSKKPKIFDAAINEATMEAMEVGATSKDRGLDRRMTLLALARDSEALGKLRVDSPDAFGEMREAVARFKEHSRGLVEAAESASIRLATADCGKSAPPAAPTPKKSSKRSAPMAPVATNGAPRPLTDTESDWLAAYREMDDESQEEMLKGMQRIAREYPRGPRLRLVTERSD